MVYIHTIKNSKLSYASEEFYRANIAVYDA